MDTPIAELHENFILLHNFEHETPLKKWVENDETYTGTYHEDWEVLMPLLQVIKKVSTQGGIINKTNQKRVELFKDTSIFSSIESVYKKAVEFVKWFNEYNK